MPRRWRHITETVVIIALLVMSACGANLTEGPDCYRYCELQLECAEPAGAFDGMYDACLELCDLYGTPGTSLTMNKERQACAEIDNCYDFRRCLEKLEE